VVYKLAAPASLPSTATFERALRELKQLQRAQTHTLARVLDFGKDADGRCSSSATSSTASRSTG
jgi:hypothetical protein